MTSHQSRIVTISVLRRSEILSKLFVNYKLGYMIANDLDLDDAVTTVTAELFRHIRLIGVSGRRSLLGVADTTDTKEITI